MKRHVRTKLILVLALIFTIFICRFSVRFEAATHDRSMFEACEEPITFMRITGLAIFGPRSAANACINNLRQIEGAKDYWAIEKGVTNYAIVTWKDILPYLNRGTGDYRRPWCPQGGVYRLGRVGEAPTCSIPGHEMP